MYKKITKMIDFIFINLIIYIICFVWIRYYVKNLSVAIFLSMTVALVVYLLVRAMTYSKSEKKKLKAKEDKALDKHLMALSLLPKSEQRDFLDKLYSNYYPLLHLRELSEEDIIPALQWAQENYFSQFTLIAPGLKKQAATFLKNVNGITITVIDKYTLFHDMEEQKHYPLCPIEIKKQKPSIKEIFAYAFDKKRAKGYLLMGFLLIATSFLIPYKLYYIIVGSALLLLALLCLTLNNEV